MTGIAFGGCHYMVVGFAGGSGTIVTTGTGTRNAAVIKTRRLPGACAMTLVAFGSRIHMVTRLARGLYIVVTGRTGCGNTAVIEAGHLPHSG